MAWEPTDYAWQYELLDKLPSGIDAVQLERGLRMTFTERLEAVRQLAEFADELRRGRDRLGGYPEASRDAIEIEAYGRQVRALSLSTLERSKRAAGRAKDLADLEAIREI